MNRIIGLPLACLISVCHAIRVSASCFIWVLETLWRRVLHFDRIEGSKKVAYLGGASGMRLSPLIDAIPRGFGVILR